MKASDIPAKFPIPFAENATGTYKRTIPETTADPAAASLSLGFPPATGTQPSAGGVAPDIRDENGILFEATAWLRWAQAGGGLPTFDGTFASAIGGYPQGAILSSTTLGAGFWLSLIDDNSVNPDTTPGNPGWVSAAQGIQTQAGNFGVDIGATNSLAVTLDPAPPSFLAITGTAIRVLVANTTTNTTPTLNVNGLGAKLITNPSGQPMKANQIVLGHVAEFVYNGTSFDLVGASAMPSVPGAGLASSPPTGTPNSGYVVLPNSGIIIQWGQGVSVTGAGDVVTFPIPFPNQILSIQTSEGHASGWNTGAFGPTAVGSAVNGAAPLTSFLIYTSIFVNATHLFGASGGVTYNWLAIGR